MSLRVKEVCKEKGVTITQLAEMLGIKQESLSRAINGNPTLDTLQKIAIALNVPVSALFDEMQPNDNIVRCPNCGTELEVKKKRVE